jgi:hypothetical protein
MRKERERVREAVGLFSISSAGTRLIGTTKAPALIRAVRDQLEREGCRPDFESPPLQLRAIDQDRSDDDAAPAAEGR